MFDDLICSCSWWSSLPGSDRLGRVVGIGLPKSISAGDGSLLSIGVALICSRAICMSVLSLLHFFRTDFICLTCLSTKPLLLA